MFFVSVSSNIRCNFWLISLRFWSPLSLTKSITRLNVILSPPPRCGSVIKTFNSHFQIHMVFSFIKVLSTKILHHVATHTQLRSGDVKAGTPILIPLTYLLSYYIVSIHFNNFPCMKICDKGSSYYANMHISQHIIMNWFTVIHILANLITNSIHALLAKIYRSPCYNTLQEMLIWQVCTDLFYSP